MTRGGRSSECLVKLVYPPYAVLQDRLAFLESLTNLATGALDDLLRPEGLQLWAAASRSRQPLLWDQLTESIRSFESMVIGELPKYQLAQQMIDQFRQLLFPQISQLREPPSNSDAALANYIKDWLEKHNLMVKWMYVVAENTLAARWNHQILHQVIGEEEPSKAFYFHLPEFATLMGGRPETGRGFAFGQEISADWDADLWLASLNELSGRLIRHFDPRIENNKKKWVTETLSQYKITLSQFYDSAIATDQTMYGTSEPTSKRSVQHFDWFVRFQVLGETVQQIAQSTNEDGGDVRNVNRRLKDVSERLAIKRRDRIATRRT